MQEYMTINIKGFPSAEKMRSKSVEMILNALGDQLRSHNGRSIKWCEIPNYSDFFQDIRHFVQTRGYAVTNEGFSWICGPYMTTQSQYKVENFPTAATLVKENVEFYLKSIQSTLNRVTPGQRFIKLFNSDDEGFHLYKKEIVEWLSGIHNNYIVKENEIHW